MKKNNKFLLFLVSVILVSIFCLTFIQSEVDDSSFDIYSITERLGSELQKNKYLEKYYGGRYIDEQGNFVVLVTKDAQANVINIFDSALSSDKIIYSPCDYSMVELKAIKEEINALWFNKDLDPKFSVLSESLGMTSIRDDLNRIVVNFSNCNEEKIALLKEYVSDFDAIIIGEDFEYQPHAKTLSPGEEIKFDDISEFPVVRKSMSIGFRHMASNLSGYTATGLVTIGNSGVEGSPVFDSLGDQIGEIRRTSFTSSTITFSDSAFVQISQPSKISNNIAYGVKVLLSSPYITQFSFE